MEIKCSICGAVNDGSTNFCKDCFQKLDITEEEIKKEEILEEKTVDIEVNEEEVTAPWLEDAEPIELASLEDTTVSLEVMNDESKESDNWDIVDEQLEEKVDVVEPKENKDRFFLKFFGVYYFSLILIFIIIYFTNKFIPRFISSDNLFLVEIILYSIGTLISMILATVLVLKNKMIKKENINKVSYQILSFIVIPSILIELFILGFIKTNSVFLLIIGTILSIITINIFFNFMRNKLRKNLDINEEDKNYFKFGIISVIIIIALIGCGVVAKNSNLTMPSIPFLSKINSKKSIEMIELFIYETEKTILKNQVETPNYVIPPIITDVTYAIYEGIAPESMELIINENGGVVSGTITYKGIIYKFDGESIKTS